MCACGCNSLRCAVGASNFGLPFSLDVEAEISTRERGGQGPWQARGSHYGCHWRGPKSCLRRSETRPCKICRPTRGLAWPGLALCLSGSSCRATTPAGYDLQCGRRDLAFHFQRPVYWCRPLRMLGRQQNACPFRPFFVYHQSANGDAGKSAHVLHLPPPSSSPARTQIGACRLLI